MIESIAIAEVATYGSTAERLTDLSNVNFIFGSNGTGKTSISRVVADENAYPTCSVAWKGGTKLQPLVYNSDFVERNFLQLAELKGVFTLGEQQADTLTKIASAKAELDTLTSKIETLTKVFQGSNGSGGKKAELAAVDSALTKKCWEQKVKHDTKLQGAFEGFRNNLEKFKNKVLQEFASNTTVTLTLAELENKAATVFGPTPTVENAIQAIDTTKLSAYENDPILSKRVVGKEDVDIAAMIKRLGNSDWVRQGRHFHDANDDVCPFCQQDTTEQFSHSLDEYFDETFLADTKSVSDLFTNYVTELARLQQQIAAIIEEKCKFLDIDNLKMEKELLDSKISINIQRLDGKKKEASQIVTLESLTNVFSAIKTLIDNANNAVTSHNNMVANLSKERKTLTLQIWRYVIDELKADLDAHKVTSDNLGAAMKSLSAQISAAGDDKRARIAEIAALEKQTTSVQPTIDGINALLGSFGFQGFKLAKAASGKSYKLVRADGTDAKATLSEGEKTFVTFLYFYHLLKGSESESGMTTNRVVVFDDPVSSLDSDILFIVSSLIKGLFDEIVAGSGHIKQIFVLTHNVYFHKEITFNKKRSKTDAMKDETFWIIRKSGLSTKVEKHSTNPITTSYNLLWAEVRAADRSNLSIQNTLRRILENYFKVLGGVDSDKICNMFDGSDRLICNSLFSLINDGSHFAHDDVYVSIDSTQVENYLRVFRAIFQKSDHIGHYKMMMGDAFEELIAA